MSIQVALTFDDLSGTNLPVTTHIINVLRKHNLHGIYGFANGLSLELDQAFSQPLTAWCTAGQLLANHTYSHLKLSQTTVEHYIEDISKNAFLLNKFQSEGKKYFRYPFLDEGDTLQKRNQVRELLQAENYQIVPTTVYLEEYRWNPTFINCLLNNDLENMVLLKKNLVKHALEMLEISCGLADILFSRNVKHILLLHESLFNAYLLDDILTAFKAVGVEFIALDDALSDEIYQLDPKVLGVDHYGFLGQLRANRRLQLSASLKHAASDLKKRNADEYCSSTRSQRFNLWEVFNSGH